MWFFYSIKMKNSDQFTSLFEIIITVPGLFFTIEKETVNETTEKGHTGRNVEYPSPGVECLLNDS